MIVQIGKFGDCVNILPFAYMKSKQQGEPTNWLIGKQWASILDGVSYVNPTIWPDSDDTLHRAIATLDGKKQWVTQAWLNPDPFRETDSFAKEQWRHAGALNEYGKWPLVFDRRDKERETNLIKAMFATKKRFGSNRPIILLATTSVSTSYRHSNRLTEELEKLDATVILLDELWVTHIFDFIALYDAADLLITVDTCHLHLARASQCPVIALVNDGWKGAVPPPQTIAAWRYSELGDDLTPVVAAARNQLVRKVDTLSFICDSHVHSGDRHRRAMDTHPLGMIYFNNGRRPTMKEVLEVALDEKDAVVFTHDDVSFKPDTIDRIKAHLQKFDFGCSRRHAGHIGREIFWFRSDWLRKYWDELPNPYWSVQKPDLILARWLRHLKGIPTTMENLNYDFPPAEVPDLIYHEDHESNWDNPEVERSMEGMHNEQLWAAGV